MSWYEAAAYAEFAGKRLPTVYHWNKAAQPQASLLIAPGSNFREAGTWPVGSAGAISGFGRTDMAGNHFFPVESSRLPLFRQLGTPEKDKRQVIYDTGHAAPRKEFIPEASTGWTGPWRL